MALIASAAFEGHGEWTRQSRLLIALCFVFNMIDGMDILVMSFISPALQRDWRLSAAEMSVIFSAGLCGMACGGVVVAPLADRFGRRPLILLALALMTLGMILSSRSPTLAYLVVARALIGIGIGTVLACIAALAAAHAPPGRRDFAVGVLQAGYPLGATITGFLTAMYLPALGWRSVLLLTGLAGGVVLALAIALLPKTSADTKTRRRPPLRLVFGKSRWASSLLLWTATICGFMALYFIASWITRLAIEAGLPETQAIFASAIYNIGSFCGVVGMSLAATRFDIRHLASGLLTAAAGAFLWFGGVRMPAGLVLTAAFFLGVVLQGGFNALYPLAARVYPDAVRATGIGWAMGIGRIGAFTGPLLGGRALGLQWPLLAVFGMFCIPLMIAAVCARFIRFER
jgi:AAHS family 4-hydroxybenzoate transporter-like MFS transporter